MRNLTKIMLTCMSELDSIGIDYSQNIARITVNHRLSRTLGRCKRNGGIFTIEIAPKVAMEDIDPRFLMNVIMHELLHTCPGCFNHGASWKSRAARVNAKLGYHVTTTETAANMQAAGITPIGKETARYALVCRKCGKMIYRQRWCAALANPEGYRHTGCGGDLYIISLDPTRAVVSESRLQNA